MGMGYSPGQAGRGFGSGFGQAQNNLNQGTNNIGQVYQDMGQNYQQFGQAYQQATQAADQLRSASTTQQQQMNQYLQALQTALGGMSTAGQNTTNQQPVGAGSTQFPVPLPPSSQTQPLAAPAQEGSWNLALQYPVASDNAVKIPARPPGLENMPDDIYNGMMAHQARREEQIRMNLARGMTGPAAYAVIDTTDIKPWQAWMTQNNQYGQG